VFVRQPAAVRRSARRQQSGFCALSVGAPRADGTLFAGDGGDEEMVAHAKDGKWIYLYRTEGIPDVAGIKAPNAKDLIKPGLFKAMPSRSRR
jgi:hypothetical protein